MLSLSIEAKINTLNHLDAYPIISTIYSGPARILAAIIQVVAGTILAVVSAVFGWTNGLSAWGDEISLNFREIGHGIGNCIRGIIAICPFAGNLVLYLYDRSASSAVVLKRDPDGLYTLPHFDVPGFSTTGTTRGRELKVIAGDFIIDTANKIVPKNWILQA